MAEDTARTWLDEMRAAVQALADDSWTAAQADDFWDHAERAPVRLAIYGALDAGKSTLLKRLLVEDGDTDPRMADDQRARSDGRAQRDRLRRPELHRHPWNRVRRHPA